MCSIGGQDLTDGLVDLLDRNVSDLLSADEPVLVTDGSEVVRRRPVHDEDDGRSDGCGSVGRPCIVGNKEC